MRLTRGLGGRRYVAIKALSLGTLNCQRHIEPSIPPDRSDIFNQAMRRERDELNRLDSMEIEIERNDVLTIGISWMAF